MYDLCNRHNHRIFVSGGTQLAPHTDCLSLQLEYDNTEGMILLSELSRRRIRSVQKLIRVGRNEVVVVLRVDKEKGADLYLVHNPIR